MTHLIPHALSLLLGALLVVGAFPKLRHPKGFVLIVWEYQVLPRSVGTVFARLSPVLELFLGLLLVAGVVTPFAAAGTGLLLSCFTVGVAINAARGRRIECGCFGTFLRRRVGWPLVAQNAFLIAACGVDAGFVLRTGPWPPFLSVPMQDTGLAVVVTGLITVGAAGLLDPAVRRSLRRQRVGSAVRAGALVVPKGRE
jgi:uncharacterized membrane protein YphA (DoxX/SURF4 family)